MPPIAAADEVVLTLPAAPEFVRLARLTCAGLATRIGLGYDEVEDLRIAVGEACSLLIGPGDRPGTLTLTFELAAVALSVSIVGGFAATASVGADDDTSLSDQILDAVVDEHEVDLAGDRVWISKRLAPPAGEADPA